MTNQEVISFLNKIRKILLDDKSWLESTIQPINEAFDKAISALEKQIPMKMPGTYTDYKCAVCGRRIRSGKGSSSIVRDNFCQRCGQAIDWKE